LPNPDLAIIDDAQGDGVNQMIGLNRPAGCHD
jgi:hypothetical protein